MKNHSIFGASCTTSRFEVSDEMDRMVVRPNFDWIDGGLRPGAAK